MAAGTSLSVNTPGPALTDLTTVDVLLNQSATTDYRMRDLVTRIATSKLLITR